MPTIVGVTLDIKLTFEAHLNDLLSKVNKIIGFLLLCKLQNLLLRTTLITIYKAFLRPHMDYGDVDYEEAFSNSFHEKLEFI